MRRGKKLLMVLMAMLIVVSTMLTACNTKPPVDENKSGKTGNQIKLALQNFIVGQSYKELYDKIYPQKSVWDKLGDKISYATYGRYYKYADFAVEDSINMAVETAAASVVTNDVVYESSLASASELSKDYSTTNLQEIGVDEGDSFKTDGDYIYILKNKYNYYSSDREPEILIVKVDGSELNLSSTIQMVSDSKTGKSELKGYNAIAVSEMYIDHDRLIAVGYYELYDTEDGYSTVSFVKVYDIADRTNPSLVDEYTQSGMYTNSRKIGDVVYIVSDFYKSYRYYYWGYYYGADYPKYSDDLCDEYFPSANGEVISVENIMCPNDISYSGFAVLGSVDTRTGKVIDAESMIMDPNDMYVSETAIYFMSNSCQYGNAREYEGVQVVDNMSLLAKYMLQDGQIEFAAECLVPGWVDDQFCFSEKDGNLRVATTSYIYNQRSDGSAEGYYGRASGVYVYDKDLNLIGQVTGLGKNEDIKSARFIGDIAYVVTFIRTDPLFAIDLSDPTNPVVLDELKIPGFSEYMHPYGDGKVLGIGYEANEDTGRTTCIKLSMFDVSDPTELKEESKLLLEDFNYSSALYDHKAILVDYGHNLIGFQASGYEYAIDVTGNSYDGRYVSKYFLFQYVDGQFKLLLDYTLDDEYYYEFSTRGMYIDDYFYVVNDESIASFDMKDYTLQSVWGK